MSARTNSESASNRRCKSPVSVALALGAVIFSQALADPTLPTPAINPEARHTVQQSSQRIAELVRLRPPGTPRRESTVAVQQQLDREIAAIQQERAEALEAVVLAQNPGVELADRKRAIYRVPVADGKGQTHWLSARIPAIWHLHRLDPAVFTLAKAIRARPQAAELPANTRVATHLLVGGTSVQSMVHPFPGDVDYDETFVVHAPTPADAGQAMAAMVVDFVSRTSTHPRLEFDTLRIMPIPSRRVAGTDYVWPRARVLDPGQRPELARQLADIEGGRVNTDWRALVSGERYLIIGKIMGITALSSISGKPFFATGPLRLDFQVVYLGEEVPATHRETTLGDYASYMRERAKYQLTQARYLKAAKRGFNFCRSIGDLECVAAVVPVFAGPEAEVYNNYKVLEAVAMALDPKTPSRILLAANARDQIRKAATVIETKLPVLPGSLPERPRAIARQLRDIAAAIQARSTPPVGVVEADADLAKRMKTLLDVELISMVRLSLKERVETTLAGFIP